MGQGKKVLGKERKKRSRRTSEHGARDALVEYRVPARSTLPNAPNSRGAGQDHSARTTRPAPDTAASQGDHRQPTDARQAADARIDRLKILATEEGVETSAASESDLRAFLDSVAPSRRPYIALLDNGNFRAVWKNAEQEQVGLQFLGDSEVQYVLFALRPSRRFMARAAGRDVLMHIERWIEGYGLSRLMAA